MRAAIRYSYLGGVVKKKDTFSKGGVSEMGRGPRPVPKRLAEKLRQVRDLLAVSQGGMSNLLDFERIRPAHISEYERGEREPPLPVLLRYAKLVGVSTDVLIDDNLSLSKRGLSTGQRKTKKRT